MEYKDISETHCVRVQVDGVDNLQVFLSSINSYMFVSSLFINQTQKLPSMRCGFTHVRTNILIPTSFLVFTFTNPQFFLHLFGYFRNRTPHSERSYFITAL